MLIQVLLSAFGCLATFFLWDIRITVKNTEKLLIEVAVLQTEHKIFKDDIKSLRATQANFDTRIDKLEAEH